jgi:hypothetical protein
MVVMESLRVSLGRLSLGKIKNLFTTSVCLGGIHLLRQGGIFIKNKQTYNKSVFGSNQLLIIVRFAWLVLFLGLEDCRLQD